MSQAADRPKSPAEVLALLQPIGRAPGPGPELPRPRAPRSARRPAEPRENTETAPPSLSCPSSEHAATPGAEADESADEQAAREEAHAQLGLELTHGDAQRMVAITARRALLVIEDPHAKDSDKKHSAVSLGVAIDKWIALTARPARPEAPAADETMRPGVLDLAYRLAANAMDRAPLLPAPTNGTTNGTRPPRRV